MSAPIDLTAVKRYMRLEDAPDEEVLPFYLFAENYLRDTGIYRTDENQHMYDIVLWGLSLYYYDHRDDVGADATFPAGLQKTINKLKFGSTGGVL